MDLCVKCVKCMKARVSDEATMHEVMIRLVHRSHLAAAFEPRNQILFTTPFPHEAISNPLDISPSKTTRFQAPPPPPSTTPPVPSRTAHLHSSPRGYRTHQRHAAMHAAGNAGPVGATAGTIANVIL